MKNLIIMWNFKNYTKFFYINFTLLITYFHILKKNLNLEILKIEIFRKKTNIYESILKNFKKNA